MVPVVLSFNVVMLLWVPLVQSENWDVHTNRQSPSSTSFADLVSSLLTVSIVQGWFERNKALFHVSIWSKSACGGESSLNCEQDEGF